MFDEKPTPKISCYSPFKQSLIEDERLITFFRFILHATQKCWEAHDKSNENRTKNERHNPPHLKKMRSQPRTSKGREVAWGELLQPRFTWVHFVSIASMGPGDLKTPAYRLNVPKMGSLLSLRHRKKAARKQEVDIEIKKLSFLNIS